VSPTVVGNGREPEGNTTAAGEAALAVEPALEVVTAAVDPVPLALPHPVRASPAMAATTANAPAGRRTSCA
jgi:hypothetical protein